MLYCLSWRISQAITSSPSSAVAIATCKGWSQSGWLCWFCLHKQEDWNTGGEASEHHDRRWSPASSGLMRGTVLTKMPAHVWGAQQMAADSTTQDCLNHRGWSTSSCKFAKLLQSDSLVGFTTWLTGIFALPQHSPPQYAGPQHNSRYDHIVQRKSAGSLSSKLAACKWLLPCTPMCERYGSVHLLLLSNSQMLSCCRLADHPLILQHWYGR